MLVRAYDDTDARMQEEVLKKTLTLSLARKLDSQLVKQSILPRVHGLALKTTVAAVRVNALICLGDMVVILDKPAVLEILQTIRRCTAVDRSAPTLMCTLGVANSILKQHGVDFAVEHVLPLLVPLLLAQQLNVQQFAKYMSFVKNLLRKVEEKKGVTMSETGIEVKSFPVPDGSVAPPLKKNVSTSSFLLKSNATWDEDWVPAKPSSTQVHSLPTTPLMSSKDSQFPIMSTAPPNQQQQPSTSCPAVDLEWPPRSSFNDSHQKDETMKRNNNNNIKGASASAPVSSSPSFDDLDPFANWLTQPNHSSGASNGSSTNNTEYPSSSLNGMRNNQKSADLGSIFGSSKTGQAPRLAPPPPTAVGRGRGGRNQGQSGRQSRPANAKPTPDQPPLLDLL